MLVSVNNRFQGGKRFDLFREERRLVENNREFLCDQKYRDEENLPEKLTAFKLHLFLLESCPPLQSEALVA